LPEIKVIEIDAEQAAARGFVERGSLINDDYNARLETEELDLTVSRKTEDKKDVEVEEHKEVETSEEQALYLIIVRRGDKVEVFGNAKNEEGESDKK
jgi:hypothetical protein